MWPLLAMGGAAALGGIFSGIGAHEGAEDAASAQRYAADQQLRGMREAMAAQERWGAQAREDWAPFREMGLQGLRDYYQMATNPNLDAIRGDYQDAVKNLSAQLSGIGLRNSTFAAKARANMASDYASKMYDARLRALSPLLGVGGQAAGGMAGQAGALGQGLSGALQHGYGAYGQGMGQAGMYGGMATSAGWGAAGNALSGIGALGAAGMMGKPGGYSNDVPMPSPDYRGRGAMTSNDSDFWG